MIKKITLIYLAKRDGLSCIANITVRNTKMCIFAFLYYAKDLLNNSSTVKYVPYLHNNSSTLESQNSVIRASNRDTAQGLEKAVITSNLSSGMKSVSYTHLTLPTTAIV